MCRCAGCCKSSLGTLEPAYDKIYKTSATSEDSDHPAHQRSLIRVFADCICLLQTPCYPKRGKRKSLPYWADVETDLSLGWSHKFYCRFCHVLAHISEGTLSYIAAQLKDQFRQLFKSK